MIGFCDMSRKSPDTLDFGVDYEYVVAGVLVFDMLWDLNGIAVPPESMSFSINQVERLVIWAKETGELPVPSTFIWACDRPVWEHTNISWGRFVSIILSSEVMM